MKKQTKIAIVIGAILALGGTAFLMFKKKSGAPTITPPNKTKEDVKGDYNYEEETPTTPTPTPTTARYSPYVKAYAEGSSLNTNEVILRTYKDMVSMGAFLVIDDSELAKSTMRKIHAQRARSGMPIDKQLLLYIAKSKTGQNGVEKAMAIIGDNFGEHIDFFIKNKKFKVNKI